MKKLLSLSFFLCLAVAAWASIPITVSGTVLDGNGLPAASVSVNIFTDSLPNDPSGIYFNTVLTDANGNYTDAFEVDDNQTQGNVYAMVDCQGTFDLVEASWWPGNTDLDMPGLTYCANTLFCSVWIEVDSATGTNLPTLTAIPTGTAPYTYSWDTGESTQSIMPTQEGVYCVVVTDSDGCSATACVVLTIPPDCSVDIQINPATGYMAFPTGTSPFSYLWSTGETTQNIFPTVTGDYCVTVTDADGCEASDCEFFWDGGGIDSCSVNVVLVQNGGWVFADATGIAPFTYLWSNGESTSSIALDPNTIPCVTITDATGCVATGCLVSNPTDCDVDIELTLFGELGAIGSGGTTPYVYEWNTGENSQFIIPGSPGDYCVTLTDADGCTSSDCFFYGDSINCSVFIAVNQVPGSNGYELTAITNGTPPYTYFWDNGETTPTITVSDPGVYCVTMSDAAGCFATACVDVVEQPPLFTIAGTVHLADSSNFTLLTGVAYLVVYDPANETLEAVEEVAFAATPNGFPLYSFGDVPAGEYLVKIALDPTSPDYADNLPTYYGDVLFWDEATSISVPYINPTSFNITLVEGNNPGGPGFIGGNVNDGANLTGIDDRGPVEAISVLLLDDQDNAVGHSETDANGKFAFPDLAWGTYQVIVEITGITHTIKWVTIGPDNPEVTNIQFVVTDDAVTTGTFQLLENSAITLSPNPVVDQLLLEINAAEAGGVQLRILDLTGRMVQVQSLELQKAQNSIELNLNELSEGMYILQLTDGQSGISRKFIKL